MAVRISKVIDGIEENSYVKDMTGKVRVRGEMFPFTLLIEGDIVAVKNSGVQGMVFSDEYATGHGYLKGKKYCKDRRSAKVVYVGEHYVTVEYSAIKNTGVFGGGATPWRESFGLGEFGDMLLIERGVA